MTTLARRVQVRELYIHRHMSQREVAAELKVNLSTVTEDVAAVCGEILAECRRVNFLGEIVGRLRADHEQTVKAAWNLYLEAAKAGDRGAANAALGTMDRAHRNLVDNLTRLGIVEAAPEKVEISTAQLVVEELFKPSERKK